MSVIDVKPVIVKNPRWKKSSYVDRLDILLCAGQARRRIKFLKEDSKAYPFYARAERIAQLLDYENSVVLRVIENVEWFRKKFQVRESVPPPNPPASHINYLRGDDLFVSSFISLVIAIWTILIRVFCFLILNVFHYIRSPFH